jgi:hypothetical protein
MRKLIFSVTLVAATILMLMPVQPVQPVRLVKAMGFYEEFFTVRYNCIIGPPTPDNIEGEWRRDCNGNMTGWGWEPGHNCTYTEVTYGNECLP